MYSQAHWATGDLLEDFFFPFLGASHPSSWMWYLQSGHISHLLGLFLESCVLAACRGQQLPCTSKLQRDADILRAYQGTAEPLEEVGRAEIHPLYPKNANLMRFFSTSTHPLPAASFSRWNFSASRFCSTLLHQGLLEVWNSPVQPSPATAGMVSDGAW